jgi:hypothetical protein
MELKGSVLPPLLLTNGLLCVALFKTGLLPPPTLENRSVT